MATPTNPGVNQSVLGAIGINPQRRTNKTTETNPQEFALGTMSVDNQGRAMVYVLAAAAVGSNLTVTLRWPTTIGATVLATSVVAKTTPLYENYTAAFAAGDYGWVRTTHRIGETNYKGSVA